MDELFRYFHRILILELEINDANFENMPTSKICQLGEYLWDILLPAQPGGFARRLDWRTTAVVCIYYTMCGVRVRGQYDSNARQ